MVIIERASAHVSPISICQNVVANGDWITGILKKTIDWENSSNPMKDDGTLQGAKRQTNFTSQWISYDRNPVLLPIQPSAEGDDLKDCGSLLFFIFLLILLYINWETINWAQLLFNFTLVSYN